MKTQFDSSLMPEIFFTLKAPELQEAIIKSEKGKEELQEHLGRGGEEVIYNGLTTLSQLE